MSVHSIQRKRRRDPAKIRYRSLGCHEEYLSRICRTLYYAQLPCTERLSLPVTEVAAELFSEVKAGRSLDRLGLAEASCISRNACVSPASLVLTLLYLDRLKLTSPEYLLQVSSTHLFLVSSLVASKFLNDDGEDDEVLNSEWAASADLPLSQLNNLEKEFLAAINWEVYVESDEFWKRLDLLEEEVALRQATKRGFFTYTDLMSLLGYLDSLALAHTLLSVGAVCLTAYAAGVGSMVASTALVTSLHRSAPPASPLAPQPPANQSLATQPSVSEMTECGIKTDCLINSEETLYQLMNCPENSSCILANFENHIIRQGIEDDSGWQSEWRGDCGYPKRNSCRGYESTSLWGSVAPGDSLSLLISSVVQPLYSYVHLVSTH